MLRILYDAALHEAPHPSAVAPLLVFSARAPSPAGDCRPPRGCPRRLRRHAVSQRSHAFEVRTCLSNASVVLPPLSASEPVFAGVSNVSCGRYRGAIACKANSRRCAADNKSAPAAVKRVSPLGDAGGDAFVGIGVDEGYITRACGHGHLHVW
jgi:hypothetical protein